VYKAPKSIQAPKPPKMEYWPEKSVLLNGGVNYVDREWKLANNQTSKAVNVWYREGELSKRFGQDEKLFFGTTTPAIQMAKTFFKGKIIIHAGDSLIAIDPNNL